MYLKKTLQKKWKIKKNKITNQTKIESRKAFYLCPIIV